MSFRSTESTRQKPEDNILRRINGVVKTRKALWWKVLLWKDYIIDVWTSPSLRLDAYVQLSNMYDVTTMLEPHGRRIKDCQLSCALLEIKIGMDYELLVTYTKNG